MPRRSERGFTLIEICIVLVLAVMLISIAMPSLTGQLARRKLQEASDRLELLATTARERSAREGRPYLLVWEKNGTIALYPADASAAVRNKNGPVSTLTPISPRERYTLERGASLTKNPTPEWTFWPTGNCEPVSVHYESGNGEWTAAYNALTGRSMFSKFIAR